MTTYDKAYGDWQIDPTPERMGQVLRSLDPVLVQEVQNYAGPRAVLHIKAKKLALDAVRTYDATKGANLRTWVTNQLKPLSRYGASMEAVKAPELAKRKAAEVYRTYEELHDRMGRYPTDDEMSDEIGISKARLEQLRGLYSHSTSESAYSAGDDSEVEMPSTTTYSGTAYAADAVYAGLDPREKVIMDWKTGGHGKEQLSNGMIAARLGVSPAFISQVSASIADRIARVAHDGI